MSSAKWRPFCLGLNVFKYFTDELKADIQLNAAKFVLEPLDLYDPFSGITNNVSESRNDLIKDLLEWKEVSVDTLALCFYQLQNYFLTEIRRGFAGIGNYKLKAQYQSITCEPDEILLPKNLCNPKDIVQQIKNLTNTFAKPSSDITEDINDGSVNKLDLDKVNATTVNDKERNDPGIIVRGLSQKALAEAVISKGRKCHVSGMGAFMVDGSRGEKYSVTLFPKEKCQWPSYGECYHILVAKLSIVMPEASKSWVINMTQLKRNSRKRVDKKSGRKRPRLNDNELSTILPAPDASILDNSIHGNSALDCSLQSNNLSCLQPEHCSTTKKPGILISSKGNKNKSSSRNILDKLKVTFTDENDSRKPDK